MEAETRAGVCETNSARPVLLIGRASVAAAGTACQQIMSFVSGLIIARVIGAAEFGIFNLARNLLDIAQIITRLGLDIGLQRHFGETLANGRVREANLLLRRVRLMAAALALVPLSIVAAGAGGFLEANVYQHAGFAKVLLVLALALPFITDLGVLGGAYCGILRLTPSVLAESVILPTVRLAIILILFAVGWRLWAVVVGTTIASCIASLYLAARARREFADVAPAADHPWSDAFRVVGYSSVLAGAVLVGTMTRSMDILLLGHFVSAQSLGQYSLVKTLLIVITLLGTAFNMTLGALIAERHARGDHAAMLDVMALVIRWVTLGTLPVFAIFLFWGSQLVLVFGESFAIPQSTVVWLAAGQFVFVILGPCGWALSMTGRQVTEFSILAAGLFISAGLCWLAIPSFGQLGAAVATFGTLLVVHSAKLIVVRRSFGAWPFGSVVPWATVTCLSWAYLCELAVASFALPPVTHAATAVTAFVLGYGVVVWAFFLDSSEKAAISGTAWSVARRLSSSHA